MTPLVELRQVRVHYPVRTPSGRPRAGSIRALDGVDLSIARGESIAVVGESGCGKSTLARVIAGLQKPTAGVALVMGDEAGGSRSPGVRRLVQLVFQDPSRSLNPRRRVRSVLAELVRAHDLAARDGVERRVEELAGLVGLPARTLSSRPSELSGGERQRVAIARALAVEPDVLVADEAVASLDASVRASVVNVLADLRRELGLTLVVVSHDPGVVRALCDRIAVMYLGRIVEDGPADAVYAEPWHPYTRALLTSVPRPAEAAANGWPALDGEPPSPLAIPPGCPFHPRCPVALEECGRTEPPVVAAGGRVVACVHPAGAPPRA